ncbi:TPA: hypothetical protein ACH3X2_006516 [Trebouxia sp. C0005]
MFCFFAVQVSHLLCGTRLSACMSESDTAKKPKHFAVESQVLIVGRDCYSTHGRCLTAMSYLSVLTSMTLALHPNMAAWFALSQFRLFTAQRIPCLNVNF